MEAVLSIDRLRKAYTSVQALSDVSFDVPRGTIFGVLGPNGSGKTTLLAISLGVLHADSGSYRWFGGTQPDAARKRIGALLETPNFYHYLSAWDNLEIAAAIKGRGMDDRERVLDLVGLSARKHSKFQTYSLGMKQRLAIGSALLGRPEVLVLDEPTNGLDPAGIAEIRELILRLADEGVTIIMASHLLDEVEKVCNHVAILKSGQMLLSGPVDEVLRSQDTIEVRARDLSGLRGVLAAVPGILKISTTGDTLQLHVAENLQPETINAACAAQGVTLSHLVQKKKSLESKFMELTNSVNAH